MSTIGAAAAPASGSCAGAVSLSSVRAAGSCQERLPRGGRLGAERQKEGALLPAKRGVGSHRGGHIAVVAPPSKAPEPRRRRPAAGPWRSGPRRTAADERSVELRVGGWGGAQPARLIVAVMRGLKVTETRKSCGGLAAELAGRICAELRPHRQQPISGSGQENRGFRTVRTQCEPCAPALSSLVLRAPSQPGLRAPSALLLLAGSTPCFIE